MKAFIVLLLAIIAVSIIASPTLAYAEPLVGVKKGDWIEYNISVAGSDALPPTHDVRWLRIEVLQVQGAAFSTNFTVRYANGTVGSAVWKFNFTEGNVEGWLIIPPNLGPGDTFYDSSILTGNSTYVTIQSEEQRTVLGAIRTVTCGSDSFRRKEWDKATGMFVGSSDHFKNVTNWDGWYIEDLTVTIQPTATNMWSPALFLGLNQTVFYGVVAVIVVMALFVLSSVMAIVVARRRGMEKPALSSSLQGKIAALIIIVVVLVEVGTIFFFPFYDVGLSFTEFNLIIQTFWTVLVLVSMWFRMRGNYFVHEITMLVVMVALVVGFSTVLLMNPFSSSMEVYVGSTLRWIMNILHGVFSIPAILFGIWLVVLWRPGSTTFATKSRRIALLTTIFWIPSYVVGVLDFLLLHTTLLG